MISFDKPQVISFLGLGIVIGGLARAFKLSTFVLVSVGLTLFAIGVFKAINENKGSD